MFLKPEPMTTSTTLIGTLIDPHPFDVGIILFANAANHTIGIHGIDNVGLILGSLHPVADLHEERIVISGLLSEKLVFLKTSCVLDGVVRGQILPVRGSDGDGSGGRGHGM